MRVYIKHHAMDGSFGRSIADMECKSISGVNVYFRKNKVLPHPWYKQFSVFNLPPGNCLFTLRYGAISGHSIGICCWQFGHSTVAVVRLALVITGLCCWTHAWLISLQCGHFVHEPTEWRQKWLQKRSYWYPQNRPCYLLDHLHPSLMIITLWWTFTWDGNISTFCAHSEKSIHIHPPQIFLSSIFQFCFLKVPDHQAKPLTTVPKSIQIYTSGHLSIQT